MKKRKGHLEVEIDPKIYSEIRKIAKKQGKSVDDIVKDVFLKKVKDMKKR